MKLSHSLAVLALFGTGSVAFGDAAITEIYAGLSGEDGTPDWIEVTNCGDSTLDTGSLFFDDENPNPANFGNLDSIMLAPGQSAIFLLGDNGSADAAMEVMAFQDIWGAGFVLGMNLGFTNGGGNLSQNGDAAYLYGSNDLTMLVDEVIFGSTSDNPVSTLEVDKDGNIAASMEGVNGAFESNLFFNDNIGDANNMISLIGSPGTSAVPAPGAVALLGLAGLAAGRRRRA